MTQASATAKTASPATAKPANSVAKKTPVAAKVNAAVAKTKTAAVAKNGSTAKPAAKIEKAPAASQSKAKPALEQKVKKPKLVRDSFTMPEGEYQVLGDVKKACLKAGVDVKKSELLRVGVVLIQKLGLVRLKEELAALPPLKAGRPKNEK